jgi:nucleotide-binding universal stress UspA family protein
MKSIEKILVPVDFSQHTLKVVTNAVKIARYVNAKLIFLHVYHLPVIAKTLESKLAHEEIVCLEKMKKCRQQQFIKKQFRLIFEAFPQLKEMQVKFVKERGMLVDKIKEIDAREKVDLIRNSGAPRLRRSA